MNTYDQFFYPIFGVGCTVAVSASCIAGFVAAWKSGFVVPVVAFVVGVIAFWAGLFVGSEAGYQAWQSIPDPPAEAFSDTTPMGALFFGWLPAGFFCGVVFAIVFGITWIARYFLPAGTANLSSGASDSKSIETGNPYQAPKSPHGE